MKTVQDKEDSLTESTLNNGTQRKLMGRHLQMIAIGGTIGTGLFLKSGDTIAQAGALGALIAYIIAGISVFCVILSLGEMATLIPISGSFNSYAERFVDPALGFTSGWTYWFQWAMTLPIELTACVAFLGYWFDGVKLPIIHPWIWYFTLGITLIAINLCTVSGFGEVEYWLSLMKILAIVVFIITGLIVVFRDHLGFNSWNSGGGPLAGNGVLGIASMMVNACFAFGGTELVGITAGEAANPRVAVPRAINGTFWRILLFYVVSIFLIGLILPASIFQKLVNASDLDKSPFVMAFNMAKISAAGDIMNLIGLIAVFSAANSSIYASSRTLKSLCEAGQGPNIFCKTSKSGVPYPAVLLTGAFGLIALLGTVFGEGVVFTWMVNLIGLTTIVTWLFISYTHIKFRQAYLAQGYMLKDLPYKSPLGIYGDYVALILNSGVIFLFYFASYFKNFQFKFIDFFSSYIGLVPYPLLYIGWKYYKGTKLVAPCDADLQTGHVSNFDEQEDKIVHPESMCTKILNFVA